MKIEPDKLCNEWSAQEFYHLVRYLAWEAHAQNEYQRIMAAKK